jgi:hypothetical protein
MNKQTQTGDKTNKQTNTQKNSKVRNNRISVLVVLVLLLEHPVLGLVFKQKFCLSLSRWLSFSGSCLVSFSLSEVWQVKFVCWAQVLEISSVAHQLSCFGVGFLLCWFTGILFLCLIPFFWGKVSDPSADPLMPACCDDLLIVFQFCSVI